MIRNMNTGELFMPFIMPIHGVLVGPFCPVQVTMFMPVIMVNASRRIPELPTPRKIEPVKQEKGSDGLNYKAAPFWPKKVVHRGIMISKLLSLIQSGFRLLKCCTRCGERTVLGVCSDCFIIHLNNIVDKKQSVLAVCAPKEAQLEEFSDDESTDSYEVISDPGSVDK
jgi:hypothetical protein